jgi:hypothetical protein
VVAVSTKTESAVTSTGVSCPEAEMVKINKNVVNSKKLVPENLAKLAKNLSNGLTHFYDEFTYQVYTSSLTTIFITGLFAASGFENTICKFII